MNEMKISSADAKSLSAYMKVARVLRERIRRGEWIVGQMLPSLSSLCTEFEMSRNSIRQALHVLAQEELISHSRGRQAIVIACPKGAEDFPKLVAAINDTKGLPTLIAIISREETRRPPDDLEWSGTLFESYQFIRKVHSIDGTPYVLNDFYVATPVFGAFEGAEERVKIDNLLRMQGRAVLEHKRQSISVTHADAETARALHCELGETIVTVRRWWLATGNRLICAATSHYLGKYFVFETTEKIVGAQRRRNQQK